MPPKDRDAALCPEKIRPVAGLIQDFHEFSAAGRNSLSLFQFHKFIAGLAVAAAFIFHENLRVLSSALVSDPLDCEARKIILMGNVLSHGHELFIETRAIDNKSPERLQFCLFIRCFRGEFDQILFDVDLRPSSSYLICNVFSTSGSLLVFLQRLAVMTASASRDALSRSSLTIR